MKQASPFKHLLLLSILLAASLPAFSQHFDWVKSYTGEDVSTGSASNEIIGSCVDSAGNLYILGEFSPQAQLCGTNLLPFEVIETSRPRWQGVVIAKISPSGELLWHKAIYNGKYGCYAYALRMIGDSNIMAMVALRLPYNYGGNLYLNLHYLDTLLAGNDDYLIPTDSVSSNSYNAFITLDLNGNVTEQHLICVGFKDSNGNALTERFRLGEPYQDKLSAIPLSDRNFNIDSEGNIYVVRSVHTDRMVGVRPCDTCETPYWSVDDGTIGAMVIVVDGTYKLTYPIPYSTAMWNQQILKFSPHFNRLIDAIYMFDSTLGYTASTTMEEYSFEIDSQNNLYVNMEGNSVPSGLRLTNSNALHLGDSTSRPTWILKYNSDLEATGVVQLSYGSTTTIFPQMLLEYPYIDDNTNSLFVPGVVGWVGGTVNQIFYNSDTLDLPNQTSFWLRLDKDDLSLLSYGQARSGENGRGSVPLLAAYNNRVFAQCSFMNTMIFGDTTIYTNNGGDKDIVFAAWDYIGQEIGLYARYGVSSFYNAAYPPIVKDSIVYLMGSIWDDATFGDITTQNYGNSQVFIAKYVDTAFMHPYPHPSDRQEQSIVWQQELSFNLADSPILLTADATSGLPVVYSCGDSSIAYVRGDTLHLVADGYAWLTATQDGDDHYFPAEPVQKLLTVSGVGIATVGADGQAKAYPNPTSGRVTLDLAKIPPAPPLPYHKPGPSDSRDVSMVLYTSPVAPFSQTETCPFPYHQRYNMKVSGSPLLSHDGVVTAWLTDMQGRREEVVLTPTGPDQYTLDLTSRPPAAYLLTVTTADGRELTFRLVKQYGRR